MTRVNKIASLIVALALSVPTAVHAQTNAPTDKPFVVEYYYKARWGFADEVLTLFKKNHFLLLKKQVEMSRMMQVRLLQTRYHTTEDMRTDYRATIVLKNATVANEPFDENALKKQLFP